MQGRQWRWWVVAPIIACGGIIWGTSNEVADVQAQVRPSVKHGTDTSGGLRIPVGVSAPDSMYREAREAMVKGNAVQAIRLFGTLAARYPKSSQAPASLYYRAFLQYQQYQPDSGKKGNPAQLRSALSTLSRLERAYPKSRQARDARSLQTRICGQLAQLGDKGCREQVVVAAQRPVPAMDKGDTTGKQRYFVLAPETPAVGPGRFYGMKSTNRARLIPIDTTCRRQRELNNYVVALNSLWKVDTLKAMENTIEVLGMRNSCLARVREQAMLMLIQRPAPMQGMAPTVLEVARNDPDPRVKRLATAWLLSQEWDPQVAKFLHAMFGQSFRVKSSR